MGKILAGTLGLFIWSVCLTGCGKDTAKVNISSNQSTTSTMSMTDATSCSEDTSKTKSAPGVESTKLESRKTPPKYSSSKESFSSSNVYSSEKRSQGAPPYIPHHVNTTDEFAEWILNTNADTFRQGYFKKLLETLRADKEFYYPYYKGKALEPSAMEGSKISIFADAPYESYGYGYFCFKDGYNYRIDLLYLDDQYVKEAKKNIFFYRNGKPINPDLVRSDPQYQYVKPNNKVAVEGIIGDAYIKQNAPDDNDRAFFIYKNQYVVRVNFVGKEGVENSNRLDEDFLQNLQFKKIKF